MKKLKCPESIEEVTPEHNAWIAENVMGWIRMKGMFGELTRYWYDKDYEKIESAMTVDHFRPFELIQHAAMGDEWVSKNKLILNVWFDENIYYCEIRGQLNEHLFNPTIARHDNKREPFARACCIWKAWEVLYGKS